MVVEREVAGRTLRARCAPRNARRASSALIAFGRLGSPDSGATLRFGWSLLRLQRDEDGVPLACEPDFDAWPEQRWRDTIDVTLDVLEAQARLLCRTGVEGEDVRLDQVLLAAPGAIAEPRAFMRRVDALAEHDCGWLVGVIDDPAALSRAQELEAVPIAHLVARRRALLQALAFPTGYVVIFNGETVAQVLDLAGRDALGAAG
jgi:hypothetical protein